jgi:cytochrome c oxidase subunit 3
MDWASSQLLEAPVAEAPVAEASPFGANWQKLMMWIFIVTDGLLFAGLLAGYGFLRLAQPAWPDPAKIFELPLIGLMTFVLISSSATMASAVSAAQQGDQRRLLRYLLLTIAGGTIFLSMQAYEWHGLIAKGASLHANPWGVPLFTACFFVITGFHGSHVLSGITVLAITAIRTALGKSTSKGVEAAGLYWHFVDLVWVFIFTLFYLI